MYRLKRTRISIARQILLASCAEMANRTATTPFTVEADGKRTGTNASSTLAGMAYNKEKRFGRHQQSGSTATYLYSADNLKRIENTDGVLVTLVGDGSDYLGEQD